MTKTGSTALQSALRAGTAELRSQGVIYNETFGVDDVQSAFAARVVRGSGDWDALPRYERNWLRHHSRASGFADAMDRAFDREIATFEREIGAAGNTVVISAEVLWAVFAASPASARWARDYLLERFDAVDMVAYLRRQDSHILSAYAQRFKGGRVLDWESHAAEAVRDPGYRYAERVAALDAAFGRDHVHVRPYEREQLEGGDTVGDFLHLLGAAPRGTLAEKSRENEAWDREVLGALLHLRAHLDFAPGELPTRLFLQIRAHLPPSRMGNGRLGLSRDTAAALLAPFRAGNERLARERLGRADGVLFRRPPPENDADVLPGADTDAVARFAAHALLAQEREIERLAARCEALARENEALAQENEARATARTAPAPAPAGGPEGADAGNGQRAVSLLSGSR